MNKKILILSLILTSVIALSILPAYAGKGQTRQSFSVTVEAEIFAGVVGPDSHASPVGSMGMDYPDQRAFHGRNCPHTILAYTFQGETVDSVDVEAYCDFEYNNKLGTLTHKITEIIDFGDGTIVLSIVERVSYSLTAISGKGRLVGFGTGAYEGVKIVGTTLGGIGFSDAFPYPHIVSQYEGTIMGWD